jgi:ribosomal-protein-alanine N-acetyltransferase
MTSRVIPSRLHVRGIRPSDLAEVLRIERACFATCWTEMDFRQLLAARNCFGTLAEEGGTTAGFMVFLLFAHKLEVMNIAVCPAHRRRGVGASLIEQSSKYKRPKLAAKVSERNLGAHLFFRSLGFRAVEVVRNYYRTDEDAYTFEQGGDT